jgi:hypothetical protein
MSGHGYVRHPDGVVTTFDAPGAGTGTWSDPGTQPNAINQEGAIVGNYKDAIDVNHGFLLGVP